MNSDFDDTGLPRGRGDPEAADLPISPLLRVWLRAAIERSSERLIREAREESVRPPFVDMDGGASENRDN